MRAKPKQKESSLDEGLELVVTPGRDAWFELRNRDGDYLAGSNTPPPFAMALRVDLNTGRIVGWVAPSKEVVRKKFPSGFESE